MKVTFLFLVFLLSTSFSPIFDAPINPFIADEPKEVDFMKTKAETLKYKILIMEEQQKIKTLIDD